MTTNSLILIKEYFNFLIKEYGFVISKQMHSPEIMGNAAVLYTSSSTGVEIVVDRGQAFLTIGDLNFVQDKWLELTDIIGYLAPEIKDVYLLEKENLGNYSEAVNKRLENISFLVKNYCNPLLMGDFSMQDQITKLEKKREKETLDHFQKLHEDYLQHKRD